MRSIFRNIKSLLFFPLVLLPLGMLFYAIGTILITPSIVGTSIFVDQFTIIPRIFRLIGNTLQTQTGLLVAIAISYGLSNKSLRAMLSTIFVYFFMQVSFNALVQVFLSKEMYQEFTNMPVTIYPFYLIGGIIIAIIVARFHVSQDQNDIVVKLDNISQKIYQSFLGVLIGMGTAIVLSILWCYVIQGIILVIPYLTGPIGAGIFGFFETLLRPIGVSSLLESLQNYTYIGGTWRVPSPINTNTYGFESIWLYQLQYNSGNFTVGTLTAAKYVSGMFVTPAIALALINTSYVEHRKSVSIILSVFIMISAVVGFTLPIEIILLFSSPLLFGINALINGLITGLIYLLSSVININLITVSGGGILDFIFFGVIPGVEKTGAWVLLIVGILSAVITYYIFFIIIKRFNLPVFGRSKKELEVFTLYMGSELSSNVVELSQESKMRTIIYALGGKENIVDIDVSMYRLHISVKNTDIVEKLPIKESGAAGIFIVGSTAQVIFGAVTQEYYKILIEELEE